MLALLLIRLLDHIRLLLVFLEKRGYCVCFGGVCFSPLNIQRKPATVLMPIGNFAFC